MEVNIPHTWGVTQSRISEEKHIITHIYCESVSDLVLPEVFRSVFHHEPSFLICVDGSFRPSYPPDRPVPGGAEPGGRGALKKRFVFRSERSNFKVAKRMPSSCELRPEVKRARVRSRERARREVSRVEVRKRSSRGVGRWLVDAPQDPLKPCRAGHLGGE